MEKERIDFARKSLEKAKNFQEEPFLKFVILWIGLNALYGEIAQEYEEGRIREFFRRNADVMRQLIEEQTSSLRGIISYVNSQPQHRELNMYLRTRKGFLREALEDSSVDHLMQFLYKVRINMFHAEKLWDEENEAKLLTMINPLLEDLLRRLIRQ